MLYARLCYFYNVIHSKGLFKTTGLNKFLILLEVLVGKKKYRSSGDGLHVLLSLFYLIFRISVNFNSIFLAPGISVFG